MALRDFLPRFELHEARLRAGLLRKYARRLLRDAAGAMLNGQLGLKRHDLDDPACVPALLHVRNELGRLSNRAGSLPADRFFNRLRHLLEIVRDYLASAAQRINDGYPSNFCDVGDGYGDVFDENGNVDLRATETELAGIESDVAESMAEAETVDAAVESALGTLSQLAAHYAEAISQAVPAVRALVRAGVALAARGLSPPPSDALASGAITARFRAAA